MVDHKSLSQSYSSQITQMIAGDTAITLIQTELFSAEFNLIRFWADTSASYLRSCRVWFFIRASPIFFTPSGPMPFFWTLRYMKMCVCDALLKCTHTHTHTHARTHTCTHTHTHAQMHTRTHTHTPTRARTCTHTHTHTLTLTHSHAHTHTHTHTLKHTQIPTRTHTHTHTHLSVVSFRFDWRTSASARAPSSSMWLFCRLQETCTHPVKQKHTYSMLMCAHESVQIKSLIKGVFINVFNSKCI